MQLLRWIIFVTCISGPAWADKMQLLTDNTVTTTAEVMARIQADAMVLIKAKYSDLQKNFTTDFLTTGLDFNCREGSVPLENGAQYAGVRVSNASKRMASKVVQSYTSISHFDCLGRLIFTERIKSLGQAAATVTVEDAVKFVRYFEVQANETARDYQIENDRAEVLFSIQSQRLSVDAGQRIYSVVEVNGAKLLELNQLDPSLNERKIFIQIHGGAFKIGKGTFRMDFGSSQQMVLKTIWNERRIEHGLNSDLTNQVTFDKFLGETVVGSTVQMLTSIFSDFIQMLPATQKVQVGVSDSPFMRELQLNYNRMQTNTEPDQVKIFFQSTIEKIKNGQLKVE